MRLNLSITKKQKAFIDADAQEVLFGGAAGGGKSFGQIVDALLFALKYKGSKQLVLRRTFAELDKSLIRCALSLYPREIYTFNSSSHIMKFKNGSVIDFGYCASENDVYQYQSAEYDVVRFDELTHFTEAQYLYLISRVRGTSGYPKQIKSSTNPGGIGHSWVKKRFIDKGVRNTPFTAEDGMQRIFIPSLLSDNDFLAKGDPEYKNRLLALPEKEKKALLYGDWDIFEGQYFSEFDRQIHICDAFTVPRSWRKYRTIDYGLDRLVCLWIAVAPDGCAYVYREIAMSDMPISKAAAAITERTPKDEEIYATLAPPDLWARSQESGKSKAALFSEHGINFTKTANDRETGWLAIKELLQTKDNKVGLKIFSFCNELIRCLPALVRDKLKPSDCANEPHDITHAPDALRGFAIFYARPASSERGSQRRFWTPDMWEDYKMASEEEKQYLKQKYGEPK